MKPLHIQTPMIYSQYLHHKIGKSVYLKIDALQPSGSFKMRGIGRLCQKFAREGKKKFIAASGGNAGLAVAYSGWTLGIPTTIFVPTTSHQIFLDEIRSYGAQVIVAGNVLDEAQQVARDACKETPHSAYIPPFDHPVIWAGHATMIREIAKTGIQPDAIVAAVGGGGLACGLLQGMHRHGWQDVPLIAVETQGADAFFQSIQAASLVALPAITSRATSLGAKHITSRLWEWSKKHPIINVVVSDDEAEQGARLFAKDKRILVEISAGAALSVVYLNHEVIRPFKTIVVVVCGGVNTSFFTP